MALFFLLFFFSDAAIDFIVIEHDVVLVVFIGISFLNDND